MRNVCVGDLFNHQWNCIDGRRRKKPPASATASVSPADLRTGSGRARDVVVYSES